MPVVKRALVALFVVYLVLLTWTVVWKLELPWVGDAARLPRPIKLVPFVASGDAGASAPLELVANLLLFVPFGLYLGLLAPSWRWWRIALVSAVASLVLEIVQHLISVGSFDSTDVIVNTVGGVAGFGLLSVLRRRLQVRTDRMLTTVMAIVTALAVVAVVAYVASPIHFQAPRDVIVNQR